MEARVYSLLRKIYKVIGILLMRRELHESACIVCDRKSETYYPYQGSFVWEREYWQPFEANECCGQKMSFEIRKVGGISGALYRLPGYKALDQIYYRELMTRGQ